ncbi:MAG: hypothetical protein SGBAC_006485 [Bacillariaceae sp.]
MTTKRRLQTPSSKDLSSIEHPSQSTERVKRPKTEKYLKQKAIYEDVIHSTSIFQSELFKLTDDQDLQSQTAHPSRRDVVKATEETIGLHMQAYEQRYLTTCQCLRSEAQRTIDLSNGFDALSRAIDNNDQSRQCLLAMLNVGDETTSAIKLRIAEYAGVATCDELDDVQNLTFQLHNDGR